MVSPVVSRPTITIVARISCDGRVPFRKAASGPTASRGRSVEARAAAITRGRRSCASLIWPLVLLTRAQIGHAERLAIGKHDLKNTPGRIAVLDWLDGNRY